MWSGHTLGHPPRAWRRHTCGLIATAVGFASLVAVARLRGNKRFGTRIDSSRGLKGLVFIWARDNEHETTIVSRSEVCFELHGGILIRDDGSHSPGPPVSVAWLHGWCSCACWEVSPWKRYSPDSAQTTQFRWDWVGLRRRLWPFDPFSRINEGAGEWAEKPTRIQIGTFFYYLHFQNRIQQISNSNSSAAIKNPSWHAKINIFSLPSVLGKYIKCTKYSNPNKFF
jgi:hypothetical protein